MNQRLPQGLLPVPTITLDATVLYFAFSVTLVKGLLFGFAPAWHATATDLSIVLKQGSRSSIGGQRPLVRSGLVAAELALATVLLVGAGLLLQTLAHLQGVRLGFQPERLLTFQLVPPQAKYPGSAKQWPLYREILQSVRAIPGVRDAGISSGVPMGAGAQTHSPFVPNGGSILPPGEAAGLDWRTVSPGYFRTMGIPLLTGRDFSEQDTPQSQEVVILSRRASKAFWGDEDPIGKSLHRPNTTVNFTVIGIVGDVRNSGLNQESPTLYYSSTARTWPLMETAIRTETKPESVISAVRARIHDIDAELPLSNIRTMEEWVSNSAAQPRLNAALLATFAAVALLIAAIGVYGVLAYSVSQRTREIGLRIALGAQQNGVLRWIVGQGMLVAAAGIGLGLAGASALSRLLASLLFGIQPGDPLTFTSVAVVLTLFAFAACLVPAVRASRIDPIVALRDE